MPNEEYWSTKCVCGAILVIKESTKNAIIAHQKSGNDEDIVEDEEGYEFFLICEPPEVENGGCGFTVNYHVTIVSGLADAEPGCVAEASFDGEEEGIPAKYVTPDSWISGKEAEITDVEEKSEMKKEQSMSEPTVDEVVARWSLGHSLYFLQFALAGIDGDLSQIEMQTMIKRMEANKAIQETLGKDGYHDEEQRFKDTEALYNQVVKEGNLVPQVHSFISGVAESYEWNVQILTLMYGHMFDVVMADGEIWSGEQDILQMMVDEWGIMAGPFLRGMTDASGIRFPPE